jgi:predicted AAA+ superfamily ATPase
VNFWRTTSGAEVDFVTGDVQPEAGIEVKAGDMRSVKITRGYRSFLTKYKPQRALLLSRNLWTEARIGGSRIEAMPIAVFLAGQGL